MALNLTFQGYSRSKITMQLLPRMRLPISVQLLYPNMLFTSFYDWGESELMVRLNSQYEFLLNVSRNMLVCPNCTFAWKIRASDPNELGFYFSMSLKVKCNYVAGYPYRTCYKEIVLTPDTAFPASRFLCPVDFLHVLVFYKKIHIWPNAVPKYKTFIWVILALTFSWSLKLNFYSASGLPT